ncbi:MAG: hypothetical protein KGZ63_13570 [Clostridiales bacterium]|jgi:hypothetical protein|nr:hypothetical protein [Clostridiales bacterium]
MILRKAIREIAGNESGSAIVLLTAAMVVLVGVMALVADVGVNYVKQTQLSVAADAAALAGGTKLDQGNSYALEAATEIAVNNGISLENLIVDVDEDGKGITVKTRGPIQTFFGIIFNNVDSQMEQLARVAMTRPIGLFNLFPLGVDEKANITHGVELNLFGSELMGSGNWGALQFKDENGNYQTGANIFKENLKNGFSGLIMIEDEARAESGAKSGPISDAIDYRITEAAKTHVCSLNNCPPGCPRVLILPVYTPTSAEDANKTKFVEIVDFAAFWVSRTEGQGENRKVWGYFVKPHVTGAVSAEGESPYGMTSIKLVK